VEIELDAIYGYRHDGENLFVVTRDKIWAISDDKLYWEKGFANEAIRSSLIFINNHIYTIYGNNLYKFDKNGNFEIVYNYDFYKSSHNLYQLKDKYLLIADRKEIIQLIVAD
jgi:hypothetical protein